MYTAETGRPAPSSPTNSQFSQWRRGKVTEFAAQLYSAVKEARPDLHVSVSPSVTTFSSTSYNADWPSWQSQGLFDEYAVQAYRDNISSFNSIINAQTQPFKPDELERLVVGLRINGSGAATPYADLAQMIQGPRREGAAGHSLWYSSGVRDLYGPQLAALYDVAGQGHAPQPMFPADHRRPPLVALPVPGQPGAWSVVVEEAGVYRVVAKVGSYWTEVESLLLDSGPQQIVASGASELELLNDRRPGPGPGDFNGDGIVDGADLVIWQAKFGQSGLGDADGDGFVDGRDFLIWQRNLRLSGAVVAPAAVVPEPSAATLWAATLSVLVATNRGRVGR